MALTTLAHVKLMLGITSTTQDTRLTAFINAASARIENWTNRTFEAKDCIEWHDGGRAVVCQRTPVNHILRVGIMDGTYFQVQYTGPDAWARVDVISGLNGDIGKMRLTSSFAGTTVLPLEDSISDLLDEINLVSGWSSTFNGQPINGKAAWIPALSGLDATLSPTDIGNGGGPANIPVCMGEIMVSRVEPDSGVIELVNDGQMYQFGAGTTDYAIGNTSYGGLAFGTANTWPRLGNTVLSFPKAYQGIVVDYAGGMAVIPDDVQQTCVDMVQYMIMQGDQANFLLAGESIGGYSYTLGTSGTGNRNGPQNGIAGVISGLDNLMRERLQGYNRIPLAI